MFAVTKTGDPAMGLFSVELEIFNVRAVGTVSYNALAISDVEIEFRTTRIAAKDAAANAAALGLSDLDVARLEGLVEGSIAPTAIRKIFAGAPRIDLRSLFPTVVFSGQVEITSIADGLLLIATDDGPLRRFVAQSIPTVDRPTHGTSTLTMPLPVT